MKKIYSFLAILSVPAILLTYSFSGGSPGGKTGSPIDNENCTQCHVGAANPIDNWISSDIPDEGFTPGETYVLTLYATDPVATKFGFELTAENSDNKIGTFTITDADRTQLKAASNSVTHKFAGTDPIGHEITWQFEWTAPDPSPEDVTFYAAVNAANGNGANSGDKIYLTSQNYTQFFVDIADNLLKYQVKLYPNPATSYVNIELPANAELRLINIAGQEIMYQKETSVSERIDLANLADGVYFVQVVNKNERATLKLIKN
jgi:hypothetical protein